MEHPGKQLSREIMMAAINCLSGGDGFVDFVNSPGSSKVKEILRAALVAEAGGPPMSATTAMALRELEPIMRHAAREWVLYQFIWNRPDTKIDPRTGDLTFRLEDLPAKAPVRVLAGSLHGFNAPGTVASIIEDPRFPEACFVYGFYRYLEGRDSGQWNVSIKTCKKCGRFLVDRSRSQTAQFCGDRCRNKFFREDRK